MSYFLFMLGAGIGVFIGYSFHQDIQSILAVHDVFAQTLDLKNTVFASVGEYVPRRVLNWLETLKFVAEYLWVSMEQYFYQSCVPYSGIAGTSGMYKVSFVIEQKPYSILVRPIRGPENWMFLNLEYKDVSMHIVPYVLGLKSLVTELTPRMLGQEQPLHILKLGEFESDRSIRPDDAFTAESF